MTFLGVTENFGGKSGALRWSILVRKQKHNVQRPSENTCDISISTTNASVLLMLMLMSHF